jgi:uncharacterized protein (DUF1684 family)
MPEVARALALEMCFNVSRWLWCHETVSGRQAAMSATDDAPTWLDLYDWRERVARMYRERNPALRAGEDPRAVLRRFRAQKDDLFARHPQSPFGPEERARFSGLEYFAYDAALRVEAELEPLADEALTEAPSSGAEVMRFPRAARVQFSVGGEPAALYVYWIDVYGGGLFLPFRDVTCPAESYGAGRYLFDTVKGSDFERLDDDAEHLGYAGGRVILDFNYAYNPSCAYDARWVCPLAPRENILPMAIRAGERKYHE